MRETFIGFITPFLCDVTRDIVRAGGVIDSKDKTKPHSVQAGEFWDDVEGQRYYFNGTTSIKAGSVMPDTITVGEKWVDTSTPSFVIRIAQ